MFTGIIEDLGTVKKISKKQITTNTKLDDIKIGDSVCVNGVCLTVVDITNSITFDISEETLKRTNISKLKINDKVNLERAIKSDGRFGGHFVTGHIDAIGKILKIIKNSNSEIWQFENPKDLSKYIVEKGSIVIDGISLTVAEKKSNSFTISVIPYTLTNTTLGIKKVGDIVNLETDILAKYTLQKINKNEITPELLKKAGYL
jgi:riboflavin synthase